MKQDDYSMNFPVSKETNPWHDGTLAHYNFKADVAQMGFNGGNEPSVGAEGGQL